MTEQQAMQLALEALEHIDYEDNDRDFLFPYQCTMLDNAITAIKEALSQPTSGDYALGYSIGFGEGHSAGKALAQPEQEYYAVNAVHKGEQCYVKAQPEQPKVRTGNCLRVGVCASEGHKIAPQRTWVGLTDEEIYDMYNEPRSDAEMIAFARAIEAAHGIKDAK